MKRCISAQEQSYITKQFARRDALDRILGKLTQHARMLNAIAPLPWSIKSDGMDGYIYDAEGEAIFGGESGEGYISKDNEIAQMLVKLVNDFAEDIG